MCLQDCVYPSDLTDESLLEVYLQWTMMGQDRPR